MAALPPAAQAAVAWRHPLLLWLKFVVLWRGARLWAWADGLAVPENLPRCIYHESTLKDFWRHWHASFHAWLRDMVYLARLD